MNNLRVFIYKLVPKKLYRSLGRSKFLKPLRDFFFRSDNAYREHTAKIRKQYGPYQANFQFVSSIQIATKAAERGMETRLLNNSIELLQRYKTRSLNNYTLADVGANFGFLSLVWAKTVCDQGSVYAFEPHPRVFSSFAKSIAKNSLQDIITAEQLAVGQQNGAIEISLAETTSNTIEEIAKDREFQNKVKIEMICLDTYFSTVDNLDLIKIDVDGIELEILQGATETLRRLSPVVIVETNGNKEIIDFFLKRDYQIFNMQLEEIQVTSELPLNIFCVPN